MKHFSKLPAAALTAALLGLASLPAHASFSGNNYSAFNFSGECSDCDGSVSATLVLKDYTKGEAFGLDQFVSFAYGGSNLLGAYEITAANAQEVVGEYARHPDDGIDYFAMTFSIISNNQRFFWSRGNDWNTGHIISADYGNGATWTEAGSTPGGNAVPEPATLLLAGLGLAAIGWSRRRRSAFPAC